MKCRIMHIVALWRVDSDPVAMIGGTSDKAVSDYGQSRPTTQSVHRNICLSSFEELVTIRIWHSAVAHQVCQQ